MMIYPYGRAVQVRVEMTEAYAECARNIGTYHGKTVSSAKETAPP